MFSPTKNISQFDILFKYIMVGNINSGKTSLLARFMNPDQKWTDHYEPTLGLEFGSKTIHAKDKLCKLMVWDTAGQEIFRSIIRSYYKGAIVCLLIFDITERNSFQNCRDWLVQVKTNSHSQLKIYLVGNKCDLAYNRSVSFDEAENLVVQMELCGYFEVSAKQNINISDLFKKTASDIIDDLECNRLILHPDMNIGIKINCSHQNEPKNKVTLRDTSQGKNEKEIDNCKC